MALVEAINALGIVLAANPSFSHTTQELGNYLTIVTLVIQLVLILTFVVIAAIFYRRYAKANVRAKAVSTLLIILYVSITLIFIRYIYRLVETSGNTTKRLSDIELLKALSLILCYERFFYIFDATFMAVNSILWNIWNPGRFLPRKRHIHLSRDGTTEVEGEEMMDGRPLITKVGSVLKFGLLFREKSGSQRFEELAGLPVERSRS